MCIWLDGSWHARMMRMRAPVLQIPKTCLCLALCCSGVRQNRVRCYQCVLEFGACGGQNQNIFVAKINIFIVFQFALPHKNHILLFGCFFFFPALVSCQPCRFFLRFSVVVLPCSPSLFQIVCGRAARSIISSHMSWQNGICSSVPIGLTATGRELTCLHFGIEVRLQQAAWLSMFL